MILKTKMQNMLKKACEGMNLDFKVSNTVRNGSKRGCYGFVKNTDNGLIVYFNTERCVLSSLGYMFRYADNFKDYCGYHNRWSQSIEDMVSEIALLLSSPDKKAVDFRI